eukprot:gb/GEZN01023064.1/.p1 GENE.gb/GEZN01023064.1/~~gb/GEZN01023064.1/.p1  ORF type:complete len:131 (-),score=4.11 gb/GEZN01023064.1/:176-568(-)
MATSLRFGYSRLALQRPTTSFLSFQSSRAFRITTALRGDEGTTPSAESVRATLEKDLKPIYCDVVDTSGGCGQFFSVKVVSEKFKGKSMVQQHRIVNDLLGAAIKNIHGLTLDTKTPEKWEQITKDSSTE